MYCRDMEMTLAELIRISLVDYLKKNDSYAKINK